MKTLAAVKQQTFDIAAALKALLADLTQLQLPAIATAVAGVLAPIVAAIAGANITAVEIAGWLVIVGTVAGILQKLVTVKAAKAKPAPVPAPAKK